MCCLHAEVNGRKNIDVLSSDLSKWKKNIHVLSSDLSTWKNYQCVVFRLKEMGKNIHLFSSGLIKLKKKYPCVVLRLK
jgi:hypothetical protein